MGSATLRTKKKRPTDSIKEELKVAVTKRANQLKMDETRKANTETQYHSRDDIQHATANFCSETSMKETERASAEKVMVDRAFFVVVPKTDQWIQHERSVQLVALWIVGCKYEETPLGPINGCRPSC